MSLQAVAALIQTARRWSIVRLGLDSFLLRLT
jgi:hypothetical protein